jgi:dynein heavy chain, axonemal
VKRLDEYIDAIDRLPLIDSPQIFGLHANADITYSSYRAKTMLEKIVHIQPKQVNVDSSTGDTRDRIVQTVVQDMLIKLPTNFVPFEVRHRTCSSHMLLTVKSIEMKTRCEKNYDSWAH